MYKTLFFRGDYKQFQEQTQNASDDVVQNSVRRQ